MSSDALLSLALVALAAFVDVGLAALAILASLGLRGLGVRGGTGLGRQQLEVVVGLVGCLFAVELLKAWPAARAHSRRCLALSAVLGCAAGSVTIIGLAPWPDLLSAEVMRADRWAFCVKWSRVFVPWLAGAVVAFSVLQLDAARSRTAGRAGGDASRGRARQ